MVFSRIEMNELPIKEVMTLVEEYATIEPALSADAYERIESALRVYETNLKLVREEYTKLLDRTERLQAELLNDIEQVRYPNKAELNDWFLSLPEGRQKVLVEDKWMLAEAAFEAGRNHSTI
jgi:hypothetical protein